MYFFFFEYSHARTLLTIAKGIEKLLVSIFLVHKYHAK